MREHNYIETSWGNELWFRTGAAVTAKKSECFRKQWSEKGLFQYHKRMTKTFFVIDGSLLIHIITSTGPHPQNLKAIELYKDDSFNITPETKYRFTAVNCSKCIFIEVSLNNDLKDIYISDPPEFKI